MIAGLKGRIERTLDDAVLVDVGGIIYRANTSRATLEDIGQAGEDVRLFTHLYVREDQLTLFGFASPDELRLFETLIGVSGVGPRLALSILSRVRPEALELAINGENAELLATVPGVGEKRRRGSSWSCAAKSFPPAAGRRACLRATMPRWWRRCGRWATPRPRRTGRWGACRAIRN